LFRMLAVLCTQRRCSRVVGDLRPVCRPGMSRVGGRLGVATGRGARPRLRAQRPVLLRCRGAELVVMGWRQIA
jgi:hypothetical protein